MKNTQIKPLAIAFTVLCAAAPANAVVIANIAGDYVDATAEPEGWDYLNSNAATGGTEAALSPSTTLGQAGNSGFGVASGLNSFQVGVLGAIDGGTVYQIFNDGFANNAGVEGTDLLLHFGNNAATSFVIVRYTISATDIVNGTFATIAGSFRKGGTGSDSISSVYHNANSLFSVDSDAGDGINSLTVTEGTFNITNLSVAEGDTISFVVDRNTSIFGGETALTGTIDLSAVPEPSTSALLLGGLGMLFIRRRR